VAKEKILVIDDEQELLDLLKMSLELEDYEVVTALDGDEGLIKFKEHSPDLIICDIIMPKKDGYEVLKEIKESRSIGGHYGCVKKTLKLLNQMVVVYLSPR